MHPFSTAALVRSIQARELNPRNLRYRSLEFQWVSDPSVLGSGTIDLKTRSPPLALSFTKKRNDGQLLAVSNEDGYVKVFDTRRKFSSSMDESVIWLAHHNAIFDIQWTQDDTCMLTASGDQTIKLWNVETQCELSTHAWHTGSIKSISVHPLCPSLFVSSGRDGNVAFWDSRGDKHKTPVSYIRNAHGPKSARTKKYVEAVTAALYLSDGNLLATAGAAGVIRFWDARNLKKPLSQTAEAPEVNARRYGYTSLSADSRGNVIGSSTNSQIHMFNANAPHLGATETFLGHSVESYYVKACFSPDGSWILSGSSDGNAYVWKVNKPEEPTLLQGHSCEATAVDWCSGNESKFATCSDDFTARVWLPKSVCSLREENESTELKRRVSDSPVSVLNVKRCRTTQPTLERWLH